MNSKLILSLVLVASFWQTLFSEEGVVTARTYFSQDKARRSDQFQLAITLEIAPGYYLLDPYQRIGFPLRVVVSSPDGLKILPPIYPRYDGKYCQKVIVKVPIEVPAEIPLGVKTISISIFYGAWRENSGSLPPQFLNILEQIEIVPADSPINFLHQEIFQTEPVSQGEQSPFMKALKKGFLWSLLVAFLGGILASFTPCVYPLIPVTLSYFAQQTHQSRTQIFLLVLVYVIGIAVTYSVLGVIAGLFGHAVGSYLGSPFVVIIMGLVFVLMGLSMFGVFEFRLPSKISSKIGLAKKGYLGALFMGLILGLVAAPCMGPILVGILTYVAKQANPILGFLFLFIFALGMGILFIILGLFCWTWTILPKSGQWLVWIKRFFGVLLFITAGYFIYPLLVYVENTTGSIKWLFHEAEGLELARKEQKPVLIDFFAEWCLPCILMDKTTWRDQRVVKELQRFITIKIDCTKPGGEGERLLTEKYRFHGVPVLVFYDSAGNYLPEKTITGKIGPEELLPILREIK